MPIASINVPGIVVPNNPRKIRDDEVSRYRVDGWRVVPDEVIQEPVEMPVPVMTIAEPEPEHDEDYVPTMTVVYREDHGFPQVKHITEQELPERVALGWQEVKQDPNLPPAPIPQETPVERLETAVDKAINQKRKRGRPRR